MNGENNEINISYENNIWQGVMAINGEESQKPKQAAWQRNG